MANTVASETRTLTGTYPALAQVFVAILAGIVTALADDQFDTSELINVTIIGLGAVAVWFVPVLDARWGKWTKIATSVLIAALALLVSFLSDGVTPSEWLQVILAGFGAVGIAVGPRPEPATARHARSSSF